MRQSLTIINVIDMYKDTLSTNNNIKIYSQLTHLCQDQETKAPPHDTIWPRDIPHPAFGRRGTIPCRGGACRILDDERDVKEISEIVR